MSRPTRELADIVRASGNRFWLQRRHKPAASVQSRSKPSLPATSALFQSFLTVAFPDS
jgi:hypothetical protein